MKKTILVVLLIILSAACKGKENGITTKFPVELHKVSVHRFASFRVVDNNMIVFDKQGYMDVTLKKGVYHITYYGKEGKEKLQFFIDKSLYSNVFYQELVSEYEEPEPKKKHIHDQYPWVEGGE